MSFTEVHADAALKTALNHHICRHGSRQQHQYLELAAKHPSVVEDEIARLEGVLRLLREYLPAAKGEPHD